MGYISTIKTAVQLFPFLAFLLTLPYMILNYRSNDKEYRKQQRKSGRSF